MIEFEGKITGIQSYDHGSDSVAKVFQISTNLQDFQFVPGQFVMISAGNVKNPNDPERLKFSSMSICSAPHQKGFIELCIRMHEKPGVSKYLKENAKIGETIRVKGPFGAFVMKPEQTGVVFVSTGTGIAPLMSMLRHLVFAKFGGKIYFFYGCRSNDDFLYKEELLDYKKKLKNFELFVNFSKAKINGRQGYIQQIIKEYNFPKKLDTVHTYICGSPVSVEQQIATLKGKGFDGKNIHFEKW